MGKQQDNPICSRVSQVRMEKCGPRGKARFAKKLGISPSTYDYYESARVPPAELLVKIADVGGVDLRWLLTGEASAGPAVAADHPAVHRAAELIGDHPQAAGPLLAFLDILAGTLAFPAKESTRVSARQEAEAPRSPSTNLPETEPSKKTEPLPTPLVAPVSPAADNYDARRSWIPILGRSAAGVPRFWSEDEDATGLTTLGDLIARCTESPAARDVESGRAFVGATDAATDAMAAAGATPAAHAQTVQIITLRTPIEWGPAVKGRRGKSARPVVAQFIAAAAIKAQYPGAFAVQIDGDSMSPDIYHGDLVILSATAPAVAGMPAVVQIEGAVGVTCKIYHPLGTCLKLTPINESAETIHVANRQVEWALRVLARIRPFAGN